MSGSFYGDSPTLSGTSGISGGGYEYTPETERRSVNRRSVRWYAVISVGDKSFEATTADISETILSINAQAPLSVGQPIIVDIRSIHNGLVRIIRVCGSVRFVRESESGVYAGVSIDRIAEKDRVFFRHFANRKV